MRTINQDKLIHLLNQYDNANDTVNYRKYFAKLDKTNAQYEQYAQKNISKKSTNIVYIDYPTEPIIF